MEKKQLLVRADDLGYSKGVNYGIADALKGGIIRSVGVMVNMPETERGLELIKDDHACLGLHTNICVGKPLTDPKLIPSLVQENGEFKPSKAYRAAKEDFVNLDEVMLEIEAQYQRFVELTGQKPVYFEGHAVASDNFFKGLEAVAAKHGCDYLGMSFDGPVAFRHSKVDMQMDSMNPDYDPVQFLRSLAAKEVEPDTVTTMVCHPGYLDDYLLQTSSLLIPRTKEVEMALNADLKKELEAQGIEFITFADVA